MKKKVAGILSAITAIVVIGTFVPDAEVDKTTSTTVVNATSVVSTTEEKTTTKESTTSEDKVETTKVEEKTTKEKTTTTTTKKVSTTHKVNNSNSIPEYNGSAYVSLNLGVPNFSESDLTTTSFEYYSPLDSLGRCGVCYACIGKDIMPTEERGEIGMIKPSGWHTVRYDDLIADKYLYNRCHLIGYQLTGENANTSNLITGTRYFNVTGMLPFENEVADYIYRTNNHVLYRVTPDFRNNELVAHGVQIEAFSVEDNGKGVCFNVYCYNIQPGITIDYSTGDSWRTNGQGTTTTTVARTTTTTSSNAESNTDKNYSYILNNNTRKFHYPTCPSVNQMKEKNKAGSNATRDELIAQGYSPCGNCKP